MMAENTSETASDTSSDDQQKKDPKQAFKEAYGETMAAASTHNEVLKEMKSAISAAGGDTRAVEGMERESKSSSLVIESEKLMNELASDHPDIEAVMSAVEKMGASLGNGEEEASKATSREGEKDKEAENAVKDYGLAEVPGLEVSAENMTAMQQEFAEKEAKASIQASIGSSEAGGDGNEVLLDRTEYERSETEQKSVSSSQSQSSSMSQGPGGGGPGGGR